MADCPVPQKHDLRAGRPSPRLNIIMRGGLKFGGNSVEDLDLAASTEDLDIEMDFSLTADRYLVADHDGDAFVVTAALLTREIVGRPLLKTKTGAVAPYLDDALERVPDGRRLFIDLKATRYKDFRIECLEAAARAISPNTARRAVVMSYEWTPELASVFHDRSVPIAIKHNGQMTEPEALQKITDMGATPRVEYACLEKWNLYPSVIRACLDSNIKIILPIWGAFSKHREEVIGNLAAGVHGLITPYPHEVADLLTGH